jgi:hypothetical protein
VTTHTCLHCLKALPGNDVIEPFPFGSRVAYDSAKQRLWVVCSRCRRWSLAPLDDDERRSAIDMLERWWRGSTTRYSTDGIGVGQVNEKFSVVRVGEASFNEFAAWRHGTSLRRRNMRYWAAAATSGGLMGAWVVLGGAANLPAAVGTVAGLWLYDRYRGWTRVNRTAMCRVPSRGKSRSTVREKHISKMELVRQGSAWSLHTLHDDGMTVLAGDEAVRALSYTLPRLNLSGARQPTIQSALKLISEAGGPEGLAHRTAESVAKGTRSSSGAGLLIEQPELTLIALEIATQEQNERRLMENELALLHNEWKEAEEIAAMTDRILA